MKIAIFTLFYIISCVQGVVPVVYILFGAMPSFLRLNIELASRRNPVMLLTDSGDISNEFGSIGNERVKIFPIKAYIKNMDAFTTKYKVILSNHAEKIKRHELQCFQRWFILNEFMHKENIKFVLFADGDSALFANATEATEIRKDCQAVVNVEYQSHMYNWAVAGEASIWSQKAITDFCAFTIDMYSKYFNILLIKHRKHRSNIVDMSLLWLWWVAHHRNDVSWDTGTPYYTENCCQKKIVANDFQSEQPTDTIARRKIHDASFAETKSYQLPVVDPSIKVCNGLDVVRRTTFDHMWGWYTSGDSFSFDISGEGRPHAISAVTKLGGKPESIEDKQVAVLSTKKLYLNNIHYQGIMKKYLPYDICRVLLLTGSRNINDPGVETVCQDIRYAHNTTWPECIPHGRMDGNPYVCV